MIRKALSLDLTHFENAEFYDKLQNARREADWRALQIMNNGFYIVQNIITLLSFAAILLTFNFWLTLILFGATLPAFIAQSKYAHPSPTINPPCDRASFATKKMIPPFAMG